MSAGVAFERARGRVDDALMAGSTQLIDAATAAHQLEADLVVALHLGVPREAMYDWAVGHAAKMVVTIARGADPVSIIAGSLLQAFLCGAFTAEELAKDGES